jgi:hypothetical protein
VCQPDVSLHTILKWEPFDWLHRDKFLSGEFMSIKIITDSSSDLPKDLREIYDIEIVPLNIQFGDQHFKAGVELDKVDLSFPFKVLVETKKFKLLSYVQELLKWKNKEISY